MKKIEFFHSIAFDFLASMYRLNNYESMFKNMNLNLGKSFSVNEEITEWARTTRDNMPQDILEKLDKFFNEETFFGICLISLIPLNNLSSVDEFISFIQALNVNDILEGFLGTGYGTGELEVNQSLVEKLIKDEKYAFSFINESLSIPPKHKWELLQFFINPEAMKGELLELFNWYYTNVFNQEIDKVESIVNKYEMKLRENIRKYGDEYVTLLTGVDYSKDKASGKIVFSISYYYEAASLNSSSEESNNELYMLGYRFMELFVESRHAVLSGVQMFKSLGDETRLNIARLLSKRSWYGHELAQELKLSNSTISHHLSMLMLGGFVKSQREDNRVYYTLDIDNMKKIICESIDNIMN